MIRSLSLVVVMVASSITVAHAAPASSAMLQSPDKSAGSVVHLSNGKKFKRHQARRSHRGANSFSSARRRVMDTCPGGDKACIKELIANCDKANGGLSTEPDGGVDCYVVGIHDQ